MHADLVNLGWTDEQWNRICSAVTEEAQKARVAAQALPTSGPEDATTIVVSDYRLRQQANPTVPPGVPPLQRFAIDSDPNIHITTLAINVQLRTHEVSDPELKAALVMFRRAATHIARLEDVLVVNGRVLPNMLAGPGLAGIPLVYTVTGEAAVPGLLSWLPGTIPSPIAPLLGGRTLVDAIVEAIGLLEAAGQSGPYACLLGHILFQVACTPTANMVLPRDRILPFLQGPLLRSSAFPPARGAVIALSGNPVEIVVASDIDVRYLQATVEPRFVFRVSERVALRIEEPRAIAQLF